MGAIFVVGLAVLGLVAMWWIKEYGTEYVAMLYAPATAAHNNTWPLTGPGVKSMEDAGVKVATGGEVVLNYRKNKPTVPENRIGNYYSGIVCNPADRAQYACITVGYDSSVTNVATATATNNNYVNKSWAPAWKDAAAYGATYNGLAGTTPIQCGNGIWVKGSKHAIESLKSSSFGWAISPGHTW
jgi:hypothetical protein